MELPKAMTIAFEIIGLLKLADNEDDIQKIVIAGSIRRLRPNVNDADLVIAAKDRQKVMKDFLNIPGLVHGGRSPNGGTTVVTGFYKQLKIELNFTSLGLFGAALLHHTGPKQWNIIMRRIAKSRGWVLSQYGLREASDNNMLADTEDTILKMLDMPWVPADKRDDYKF